MQSVSLRAVVALLLFASGVALVHRACAEELAGESAGNLTLENDLFFQTDRYYTNGVQLERKTRYQPDPTNTGAFLGAMCRHFGCEDQPLLIRRHKLGQLMYTPENLRVHEPQPNDRPWAGLLYYTQDNDFLSADGNTLTTISGQVGIIGPHSYAAQTQKWIHRTFSGVTPRGWDNQIGGELGVMAMLERRMALPQFTHAPKDDVQFRATGHWRVAIGNIMTFVGAGLTFTVGKDLPPVEARGPGIDTKMLNPAASAEPSRSCLFDWLECSASATLELRAMARNVFLDGPMFRSGPSVDSRPLVADASVSARLDFPRSRSTFSGPWFVQFRATRRSPEFRSTKSVPSQSFGALTVGTEF